VYQLSRYVMRRVCTSTLFVFLTFNISSLSDAKIPELSDEVAQLIKENTFMIIPIKQVVFPLSVEKAREVYDQVCILKDLPLSERLNCQVLKSCKGEDCLREYGTHGTAFSVNGGDEIYTAWHVLFQSHAVALNFLVKGIESHTPEKQSEMFRTLTPSFVIANHNEEIVYDSRDDLTNKRTEYIELGNPLSPIYEATGLKKDQPFGYYENIPEDFVKVKLTKSISKGLVITKGPQYFFYNAGFSFDSVNTEFNIFSGTGAEMTELKKSTGRFASMILNPLPLTKTQLLNLSTQEILRLMGFDDESVKKQISEHEDSVLRKHIEVVIDLNLRHQRDKLFENHEKVSFFTNPVMSGQSGGPLFNAKGEVRGIVTNSFPGNVDHQAEFRSHGGAAHLF
jgi:hypothetical protein